MSTADEHTQQHFVVAVDGPSGSGKSSVSQEAARRLGAAYLDTGAMYRAAAWWCRHRGVPLTTEALSDDDAEQLNTQVLDAVASMPLVISTDPDHERVVIAENDITEEIRTPEISSLVSTVATNRDARKVLVERQRELIDQAERIVAEGRDITTVVAPDARVRVLLTASEEIRQARRSAQLSSAGTQVSTDDLTAQVTGRDAKDSTVVDFMTPADGVILVDSSELTFDDTVQAVLNVIAAQTSQTAQTENTP